MKAFYIFSQNISNSMKSNSYELVDKFINEISINVRESQ